MTTYKYNGIGAGIPGLPNVITEETAEKFNDEQTRIFKNAIEAGVYAPEPLKQANPKDEASASAPRKSKRFKQDAQQSEFGDEGESL